MGGEGAWEDRWSSQVVGTYCSVWPQCVLWSWLAQLIQPGLYYSLFELGTNLASRKEDHRRWVAGLAVCPLYLHPWGESARGAGGTGSEPPLRSPALGGPMGKVMLCSWGGGGIEKGAERQTCFYSGSWSDMYTHRISGSR